jgi:hypothetical protein
VAVRCVREPRLRGVRDARTEFRVTEWTITVETAPGAVTEDQAKRIAADLEWSASPAGPAVTVDLDAGLVRATYQVTGKDYAAAAGRAIRVFSQAQIAADIEPTMRNLRITATAT